MESFIIILVTVLYCIGLLIFRLKFELYFLKYAIPKYPILSYIFYLTFWFISLPVILIIDKVKFGHAKKLIKKWEKDINNIPTEDLNLALTRLCEGELADLTLIHVINILFGISNKCNKIFNNVTFYETLQIRGDLGSVYDSLNIKYNKDNKILVDLINLIPDCYGDTITGYFELD